MSSFDLFLLSCILIMSVYTYTERNMMIIETYTQTGSKTEKRLKALESIVGTHTRAINAIQSSVNYLTKVIGFKETENKKSLFQRLIYVEEELNFEDDFEDDFEY